MHRYHIWRVLLGIIWIGFGISGCTLSTPATPIPTVMKYPFITVGPTHEINEPYPKPTTTPSQGIPLNTPTP